MAYNSFIRIIPLVCLGRLFIAGHLLQERLVERVILKSCDFDGNDCDLGDGSGSTDWRLVGPVPSNGNFYGLDTYDPVGNVTGVSQLSIPPMAQCLHFNYRMFRDVGRFSIYVYDVLMIKEDLVFVRQGTHGDEWHYEEVNIDYHVEMELILKYESTGIHGYGAVGIDNIFFTEGPCDFNDRCMIMGSKRYRGRKSVSVSGNSCERWSDNQSEGQSFDSGAVLAEDNVDDAANHCRVTGYDGKPACIVDNQSKSLETCSVPDCPIFMVDSVRLVPLTGVNIKDSAAISRVEVYHEGRWGALCSQEWEDLDAEVLCREMGFPGLGEALSWQTGWPRALDSPTWLSGLRCRGNESTILECVHSEWGITYGCSSSHYDDAYVRCGVTEEDIECGQHAFKLRLHSQTRESVCVCEEGYNYNKTEGQCTGSCPLLYPDMYNYHWNKLNCRGSGDQKLLANTYITGEGYENTDGRNRDRDEVYVHCGPTTALGFGPLQPFNIAEGKPAYQAGSEIQRWSAHRAVDGGLDQHPDDCSRLQGGNAWLVVDLEDRYENTEIRILTPKAAWCKDFGLNGARPFSILMSDSFSPYWDYQSPEQEGFSPCVQDEYIECGQVLTTSCQASGRFLMISVSADPAVGYFPICELVVIANVPIWDYGNSTDSSLVPPMLDGGRLLAMVYPGDRRDNVFNCRRWIITAPQNMAIGIYVTKWSLSIEKSMWPCQRNVIFHEATPGDFSEEGRVILDRLCHPEEDIWVNSSTNLVTVEITNTKVQDLVIFEAIYRPIDQATVVPSSGCGLPRRLTFGSGEFSPSLYPDDTQNAICIMELETNPESFLKMSIKLDVFPYTHDPECSEKNLSVLNGADMSPLISLCSSGKRTVVTPSNKAIIKYTVNVPSSRVFRFTIKYETSTCMGCGSRDNTHSPGSEIVHECRASCGEITSPSMMESPRLYQPFTKRTYHIRAPLYTWVKLQFNFLNLLTKSYQACLDNSDKVTIYHDDMSLPTTRTSEFCGRWSDRELSDISLTSDRNQMSVVFQSFTDFYDGSGHDQMGFLGSWTFEPVSKTPENNPEQGYSCPSQWDQLGKSCYEFITAPTHINWFEAERRCNEQNGHLVSIQTSQEMDFLHAKVLKSSDPNLGIYIGLKMTKSSGVVPSYRWVDGRPLTYIDWDRGQPSASMSHQCSMFYNVKYSSTSFWQDAPCASEITSQYICEIEANASGDDIQPLFGAMRGPGVVDKSSDVQVATHTCDNQEYILSPYLNDGHPDCSDGSDEKIHVPSDRPCAPDELLCDGNRCVNYAFTCDHINHCFDGSDERGCVFPECQQDQFMCRDKKCIPKSLRCDIVKHCSQGEDEEFCVTEHHHMFACDTGKLIPKKLFCDGFIDCSLRAEDEESNCVGDAASVCGPEKPACLLTPGCFSESNRCVLDFDAYGLPRGCRDLTHLRNCESFQCPPNTFKCRESFCIALDLRCDGKTDCPDGDDEISCTREDASTGISLPTFSCPGGYRCQRSSKCISFTKRCDWVTDCPNGDDELLCDFSCPMQPNGCKCEAATVNCSSLLLRSLPKLPWQTRILYLNNNNLDNEALKWLENLPFLRKLFIAGNNITAFDANEFPSLPNLEELDLSYNNLEDVNTELPLLPKLRKLSIRGNGISTLRKGAFCGTSRITYLDISKQRIGDVDEESFSCILPSIEKIVADDRVFCCMTGMTNSDQCLPPPDGISSCHNLLASNDHRVCAWLVGLLVVIANAAVVFVRAYKRDTKSVSSLLIIQITIADILMGIYLLIIGASDASYNGRYAFNDSKWRYSGTCSFTGFLGFVSREAALMFIATLAGKRLFQKEKGEETESNGIKRGLVMASCVASVWLLTGILAFLPIIPIKYFDGEFYARSALCFGLYHKGQSEEGWAYAVAIFVGLNICLCLVITAILSVLFIKARRSYPSKGFPETGEIGRNVQIISMLLVNLIIWTIISIIALIAATDSNLTGELYAWTILLLFPLPSLVNPLIYLLTSLHATKKSSKYLHAKVLIPSSTEAKLCHRELDMLSLALRMETDTDKETHITRFTSLINEKGSSKKIGVKDRLEVAKSICRTLCEYQNGHLHRPSLDPADVLLVHKNRIDYEGSQCILLLAHHGPNPNISDLYDSGTYKSMMADFGQLIERLIADI